jgi:hypothetical protein
MNGYNFNQPRTGVRDFSLNEEHRMVQHMVRGFVQKEVAPIIKEQ